MNHMRLTIELLRCPRISSRYCLPWTRGAVPSLQARGLPILRRSAVCISSHLCVWPCVCHHRSLPTPEISEHSDSGWDSLENRWLNISLTSSLLYPDGEGVQENHKLAGEKVEGRREKKGFPTHSL